jgi:serine/threonine protein phosphatase 1
MNRQRRFIIGDIHGCSKTFRKLVLKNIQLRHEDTLYLLGDFIDRGPDSKGVLDFIFELQESKFNVYPLMGNHEYLLLKSWDNSLYFDLWSRNGSEQTLESFGIHMEKVRIYESVRMIPKEYIGFIKMLPLYIETEEFFFVHAGISMEKGNPLEDVESLLWTREEEHNEDILGNRILIHGHTPVPLEIIKRQLQEKEMRKVINLDGGCVVKFRPDLGNLVALDLDTFDLHVERNCD